MPSILLPLSENLLLYLPHLIINASSGDEEVKITPENVADPDLFGFYTRCQNGTGTNLAESISSRSCDRYAHTRFQVFFNNEFIVQRIEPQNTCLSCPRHRQV